MKHTNYLALGFLGIIALWMLSGVWASVPETANQIPAVTNHQMRVSVVQLSAQSINREIVIQGELLPLRQVDIRAKTTSTVQQLVRDKGANVERGATILLLDKEDRDAQLVSALAAVDSAQLELSAAKNLRNKGLQSDNLVKSAQSTLAQTQTNLERVKLDIQNLKVIAPFNGTLESRQVEIGSRVDQGDPMVTLVDESTIKAVGYVPQQDVTKLRIGQKVAVLLLDGRQAKGKITFVARVGDSQTHSFKFEAEISNANGYLNAGTSAQISISTGNESAHFLSPSVFALDDSGEVGIKTVSEQNMVEFFPIQVIKTEKDGFWVTGLPEQAEIITLGQGFVVAGETVVPVPAG